MFESKENLMNERLCLDLCIFPQNKSVSTNADEEKVPNEKSKSIQENAEYYENEGKN